MQSYYPTTIREEELKNRVAADFFGSYDCTRIVGNIDFCVSAKARDSRQLTLLPEETLFWAEAKNHPTDLHRMLAQLILTIGNRTSGSAAAEDAPPRFIGCFDNEKIAFVEYHNVLPVFNLNDFNWTQTPSSVDDKTVSAVRSILPPEKITVFRFGADDTEIRNFVRRNLVSGISADLSMQVDRNNFIFVYQKWHNEVMPHIDAPWEILKRKYNLYDRDFFLAELNTDDNNTISIEDDRPAVEFYIDFNVASRLPYSIMRKNEDELDISLSFGFKPEGKEAYAAFWRRYKRPPKREHWDYIVSRLDLLVPQDVRERKGSFFTPAIWVEKSQQYLAAELGDGWQDEYFVWDCAGGTGNLEVGLSNKYRVWVSTLDQQDVDVIKERIRNGANLLDSHVFQFDFLNDPFDKLPEGLRDIIDDPEKRRKLVIYINPPYAEAGDSKQRSGTGKNKTDVAVSHATYNKYLDRIGIAGRELFAQFLMRIGDEIPGCVVGQFSTLKHLMGPNFKAFRQAFKGTPSRSFIVPADTFDNVKGQFPIGFFVWRLGGGCFNAEAQSRRETQSEGESLSQTAEGNLCEPPRLCDSALNKIFTSTVADVYDRNGEFVGRKTLLSYDGERSINDWLIETRKRPSSLQLGFLSARSHDVQHVLDIYFKTDKSLIKSARGSWITDANLIEACVYVAVCHSVEGGWLNDRDQFLYPDEGWKNDVEFIANCAVFTLFSNANYIKSADGVNHWIPFTEEEVDAKDCFQSHFMSDWLKGKRRIEEGAKPVNAPCQGELDLGNVDNVEVLPIANANGQLEFSPEARAVLDAGRELWRYYHAQPNANPNASYYDIRLHFQGVKKTASGKEQMNVSSSDATYTELLAALRSAHRALAKAIEPKVYEYGFLKR